jgi:hypothetical protein
MDGSETADAEPGLRHSVWRQARVAAQMIRLAASVDIQATIMIIAVTLGSACATAALAASQRHIVDSAGLATVTGVVVAAALGGLAHMVFVRAQGIAYSLSQILEQRMEARLSDQIMRLAGHIPTIEHLERPAYLDRLMVLRKGVLALAGSCWTTARLGATAVSLVLTLVLLGAVHPALIALGALALPPMWLTGRGNRGFYRMLDETAEENRYEQRLHELTQHAQLRPHGLGRAQAAAEQVPALEAQDVALRFFKNRFRDGVRRELRHEFLDGAVAELAVRHGPHDRGGAGKRVPSRKADAVFVRGLLRVCDRVVHEHIGAERLQLPDHVHDLGVPRVGHIFFEREP